jgi:hypothetical protein
MNLQEAKELKIKIKGFYDDEKNAFVQYRLKNILMALDIIISDLRLEEAEKIISDRSLSGESIVKEKIRELRKQLPEHERCTRCPNPLFDIIVSSDEEPYRIGGLPVCKECYFDDLGDFIEKNPIWYPGKRT